MGGDNGVLSDCVARRFQNLLSQGVGLGWKVKEAMPDQTAKGRGPLYEYMMGTFDVQDVTWMTRMNDMLNNFGLAGWKRSVVTLLDARHLLVVMERKYPAVEVRTEVRDRPELEPEPEPELEPEPEPETEEFDQEGAAVAAAKITEVLPWAAERAPDRVVHRRKRGPNRKKVSVIGHRSKAAT